MIDFARRKLVVRLDFNKTAVRVIAEMLIAAQEGGGVNDKLSAIASTRVGFSENQIQQFPNALLPQGGRFSF